MVADAGGTAARNFSNTPDRNEHPAWSGDANWIAFDSERSGNEDIWLQQTQAPFHAFRITAHAADDRYPHLGSPTAQIERVLIGAPGSDWGGFDPVWSSAYAGICAYDDDGYRNFVRIGVAAAHAGGLQITPMAQPSAFMGPQLVGALVEATALVNLREDAGRGCEPRVWLLGSPNPGAAVLYFDTSSGKLVAALALRDVVYPAASGADASSADAARSGADRVRQRVEGDRLIVEGDFSAVCDAEGRNIAPGGTTGVSLGERGTVIDVR